MKWFTYSQNNSGGRFTDPACFVIIEAENSAVADAKAGLVGIYFDGCSDGRDCTCCGDRWSSAYGEGKDRPEVYGEPAESYRSVWESASVPSVLIWANDGTKTVVREGKAEVSE